MRRGFKYRKFGNGRFDIHTVEDFAGEYIGMRDVYHRPIFEGDKVKAFDEMLKEAIRGTITYVAPSFCITCGGYHQPLSNVSNIEIIG